MHSCLSSKSGERGGKEGSLDATIMNTTFTWCVKQKGKKKNKSCIVLMHISNRNSTRM